MLDLRGKQVLVMGLGLHGGGTGVTRFLLRQGAHVTVTDLRTAEELAPSLQALSGEPLRYVLGRHRPEDFLQADMIVRNPAVPHDSPYLEEARRRGIPVEMEMTLFFALCPGPILGVTGTKGKSTTTALLGAILRQRYPDTVVAGNIRVSALEALPAIGAATPVVLELSSWQLEGLGERGLAPHLAVVTNLYPDHMNRYRCWDDYVAAKRSIYRAQRGDDLLVLNGDDPVVRAFAADAPSRVAWFGTGLRRQNGGLLARDGFILPLQAGAALVLGDQVAWMNSAGEAGLVCDPRQILLAGRHNQENVLAATAAAALYGLSPREIAAAVTSFQGLPDRLELVRVLGGVSYINDTTSTTPASTAAALGCLSGPIVLIAGGADKGLEYQEMAQAIAGQVRAVALLEGSATPRLEQALREAGAGAKLIGRFTDLGRAVEGASRVAQPGDTVLLSPGCASFGMFRHEFDRGQRFRDAVAALPPLADAPAADSNETDPRR